MTRFRRYAAAAVVSIVCMAGPMPEADAWPEQGERSCEHLRHPGRINSAPYNRCLRGY